MAFGISRTELNKWKRTVEQGEIAFLTHYWLDERFPDCDTVTKVGCSDLAKLEAWGQKYGLKREWIDQKQKHYPHFDLFGSAQKKILMQEGHLDQLNHFK
ncbi:hypothetical protein [Lentibacillus saliphilus]|uniref:hypothetical protein n=1 Tax=Lentibacillus saliphilus TaxID=2737028 RepID=UPI001C2F1F25|nr:hypothetical protein [Lentibacillus saliphilus]